MKKIFLVVTACIVSAVLAGDFEQERAQLLEEKRMLEEQQRLAQEKNELLRAQRVERAENPKNQQKVTESVPVVAKPNDEKAAREALIDAQIEAKKIAAQSRAEAAEQQLLLRREQEAAAKARGLERAQERASERYQNDIEFRRAQEIEREQRVEKALYNALASTVQRDSNGATSNSGIYGRNRGSSRLGMWDTTNEGLLNPYSSGETFNNNDTPSYTGGWLSDAPRDTDSENSWEL